MTKSALKTAAQKFLRAHLQEAKLSMQMQEVKDRLAEHRECLVRLLDEDLVGATEVVLIHEGESYIIERMDDGGMAVRKATKL